MNEYNFECPILFMNSKIQGEKLMYIDNRKYMYAIFRAIKYFWPCLLKSHTNIIVPHSTICNLLVQNKLGEKKGKLDENITGIWYWDQTWKLS